MSIGPGTKLGQYEVQEFIGEGAMGLVYRAYHPQLERTGAVKVMQSITPDADTVARFRHEAQAIAQLRHPNIVNVYDYGEYNGTPYMIVEYVPHGSLADRMREGMLDHATAVKYLRGIAAGLDYAHAHGVIHRDVKPANVLLTAEDTPVLADFGLAKLLQGSSLKSLTGVTTGTPGYMAPEQVTGSKVGPAADRYALATIAYEMLTGAIPFEGEPLMELLYAHVHRTPPAPSSRQPSLGPQVDAVLTRGLAKDPGARWESSPAFVDALAAALSGEGAPVEPTVAMARKVARVPSAKDAVVERAAAKPEMGTPPMTFPVPATPVKSTQPSRKSHKGRWALIAAAVVLVLLVGTVTALVTLARGSPTLTLSSTTVAPGEDVVVTAAHVPARQAGEIQLWSVLHTFPFRADGSGSVAIVVTVPRDIALGDHLVTLCYSGSCRAEQTLHVISGGAVVTPTASASPSHGGPSPTPGSTPRPTATPLPTSTPVATPKTTPTPPAISISNYYIKILTGTETVGGAHFSPGSTVTITFVQSPGTDRVMGSTTVTSSGSFSFTFTVPATAVVGAAQIKACDTVNGCYSATVQVTA